MLPTFTTARPGPEFSPGQLTFAAIASQALYGMFVLTQTVRHRDFFLPVTSEGSIVEDDGEHAEPPSNRTALLSLGLLVLALVAVVRLAKVESPAIRGRGGRGGFPTVLRRWGHRTAGAAPGDPGRGPGGAAQTASRYASTWRSLAMASIG